MKKRSVGFNAILNILKTSMSVVFPLVTYRYAAQILEVENMGKVSYSSSVVSYFLLVAMLGIQVYATREGARVRDDKVALTKLVSEIFSINCISSTIAAFALLVCAFYIPIFRPYREMLLIFGLEIPLALLGSDWINSIFEDYVYITLRTIAFQIIAMICMFTLVRNKQDMFGYCVCLLISSRGSDLLNAFYTRRYVKKRFTISMNLGTHLLPIMYLFATNLASMLYSNADTTMLGLMTSDYCVGIYSTAAKKCIMCLKNCFLQ